MLSRVVAWLGLSALLLTPTVRACSVPVFRYALERWKLATYTVQVVHRGELTLAQRKLLRQLEQAATSTNLTVKTLDLCGDPTVARPHWAKRLSDKPPLPCLILQAPDEEDEAEPLWIAPFDEPAVQILLDSPARQQLVKHLLAGVSAVWLLVESGDVSADAAAEKLLRQQLKRLADELHLPEPEPRDLLTTRLPPLRIAFEVLRISRSDPREAALVSMLLQGEERLTEVTGPIVLPVFGRGRVRLALYEQKLRPTEIERWGSSLCGPCSCVVKELNPGFDLLLHADWEAELELAPTEQQEKPSLAAPPIPPGVTASTSKESAVPTATNDRSWLGLAVLVAGLFALLMAGLVLRDRRARVPQQ